MKNNVRMRVVGDVTRLPQPARQHQQEKSQLQVSKKDLDKEPLGQRVACVLRGVTEHDPRWEDNKE